MSNVAIFFTYHISLWRHRIARQFELYFCQNVRRKTMIFMLFFTRFFCAFRYYPAKQNQLKWWHSANIFTSTDLDGYPPCLILRKFTKRGPSVFSGSDCRDLDTPTVCRQNRYSGLLSSFHVFLSWQGLQRLCQFFSSQNRTGSPRCGLIWSTTVAVTAWPSFKHWTHKGCAFRYLALAFCHCLL